MSGRWFRSGFIYLLLLVLVVAVVVSLLPSGSKKPDRPLNAVVTDAKETAAVLKWTTFEMERRYRLLSRNSVRSIEDFNDKVASGKLIRGLIEGTKRIAAGKLDFRFAQTRRDEIGLLEESFNTMTARIRAHRD